ncbi:MAG: HAMP domain-containing sensor histidine kinase [Longimonas sp.]|uniref:sensor histidine kinase n=1 Tax=Longimonas sp. TaxID=2039626 RepID=UPI003974BF6A
MNFFSAFDIGTLLLTVAITALVATGLLLVSALQHRHEVDGLSYWVVSGALFSISGPLFVMQHDGLTFVSVFLPNTLIQVGLFLIGVGLRRFHSRSVGRIGWSVLAVVVAVSGVFLAFAVTGWPDTEGRIVAAAAGLVATAGYMVESLSRAFVKTLVGATIAGAATVLMGSALMQAVNVLFVTDTTAAGLVQLGSLHAVFVIAQMVATITLLFALVLVVPHQLAKQKEALVERVKEASAAKSRFLSGIVHDLKTPVTLVLGFGDILAKRVDGEEQKFVRSICRAAGDINEMARSLTELARLEEGTVELDLDPVCAGTLIRDVVDAQRIAAEKARITLRVETQPSVTDSDDALGLTARANEQALRRVVTNLVDNAIAYSGQGDTVTLRASLSGAPVAHLPADQSTDGAALRGRRGGEKAGAAEVQADEAKAVVITVSDTGPGIDPDFMGDLFEPFARNAPETEGTGLGLAVTRELVEAMHGTITAQSELGEGTRFQIRLPVAAPPLHSR